MTHIYTVYKSLSSEQKIYTDWKWRDGKKNILSKWTGKRKASVAILISDKIDFKTKAITRDKEGHYIILNGLTQQEEITLVNIQGPAEVMPAWVRLVG